MSKSSPRPEVVQFLAKEGLRNMEGAGEENISSAEVLSACFTMTAHVIEAMLAVDDKRDAQSNIEQVTDAVARLYALLPQRTTH